MLPSVFVSPKPEAVTVTVKSPVSDVGADRGMFNTCSCSC